MITTAEHVTPERIELMLYVVKFCLKIPLAPDHGLWCTNIHVVFVAIVKT